MSIGRSPTETFCAGQDGFAHTDDTHLQVNQDRDDWPLRQLPGSPVHELVGGQLCDDGPQFRNVPTDLNSRS